MADLGLWGHRVTVVGGFLVVITGVFAVVQALGDVSLISRYSDVFAGVVWAIAGGLILGIELDKTPARLRTLFESSLWRGIAIVVVSLLASAAFPFLGFLVPFIGGVLYTIDHYS